MSAVDDMYRRPSIEEIKARVNGVTPRPKAQPQPQPEAEGDVLAWFGAHVRGALRVRGWTQKQLAEKIGASPADVTKASNGMACGLTLAGKIADALGRPLGDLVTPYSCQNCHGRPPAGFSCLECGAETATGNGAAA